MRASSRKLGFVALLVLAAGCGGSSESGPLSPARALEGTWEMAFPVTVSFDTDFCTPAPTLVATQDWDVTWVVTPGLDDNSVFVEMRFSTSNSHIVAGCPGTGVVPEVSPLFLRGNVSGTTLTLNYGSDRFGTFTFTDWNMQGDLDYSFCLLYCQREYTTGRTFILRKL